MEKYKSLSFWIISSTMAFGMALTMSFFSPLLQGVQFDLFTLINNTLMTGVIAFVFSAVLPLRDFCQWILSSISCRSKEHTETALFAFFMVSIMIIVNLVIADRFTAVHIKTMTKLFLPLLVIAYFTSYLFKHLARTVLKLIEN